MCAKMLNLLCGGSAALTRENRDFLRFCNCFSQKNLQSFKRFRIRQRLVFLTPHQSRHTLKIGEIDLGQTKLDMHDLFHSRRPK